VTVTAADVRRQNLAGQFRQLPNEAFTRLQYLAPATGCFNRCAFCSQHAGREVWQLTADGLTDVAHAIATVAAERGLRLAGGRAHRPGVLFPYLDNDIGSYPSLDILCGLARDVLHVKLRISTVGYSSRSPHLAAMHQRIVAEYGDVLDGVRLSVTPYTAGWRAAGRDPVSREQFTRDMAAMLATYRPLLDRLGHGAATAAAELRFAPLVATSDLTDTALDRRHVLACGPHLLISHDRNAGPLPVSVVTRLDRRGQPVLSAPGRRYRLLTSDAFGDRPGAVRDATGGHLPEHCRAGDVTVYRLANADGSYYAADPDFHADGRFTALHLYPATATRRRSGYTDATRWFLNALLVYKAARGLGPRDPFPSATSDDATAVITALETTATELDAGTDRASAVHIRENVIPLAATYIAALGQAGYPPGLLFSRDFTIDTGQVVNQGRARALFRGLVSVDDEPMTPREERGYGQVSLSAARGTVWRIAPAPHAPGSLPSRAAAGGKNTPMAGPCLIAEELDPRHLRPVTRATGQPLRRYVVTGADLEHRALDQARRLHAYPGLTMP
jgi:hypothetical protein